MTAQQYVQLAALRTAQSALSDGDFLAWGAAPTYTESSAPVYVTYQKLRALLTKAKVDAIHAVVSQADPVGDQLLFTTGVDVNFADAKALLTGLPGATAGTITEGDCNTIRDLGRTATRPFDGLGVVLQADLDALPRLAAIAALNALNEKRYADALALYNADQNKCDRLRGDSTLALPADLAGLDSMGGS